MSCSICQRFFVVVVQLLSHVGLFVTLGLAQKASLSFTVSQNLLKFIVY